MTRARTISTSLAPAAIGPYSQAVVYGDIVLTSGQIALDPETGDLVQGDVAAQTERALTNLAAVLDKAGSSLACVLRTTVYLTDMQDFAAMNAVYARWFGSRPPARSCVAVAGLPKGARVEIDALARPR
jgi:2-iminobutanoate/2-iminopropanoate deaminase